MTDEEPPPNPFGVKLRKSKVEKPPPVATEAAEPSSKSPETSLDKDALSLAGGLASKRLERAQGRAKTRAEAESARTMAKGDGEASSPTLLPTVAEGSKPTGEAADTICAKVSAKLRAAVAESKARAEAFVGKLTPETEAKIYGSPSERYTMTASIWAALKTGHVQLLRMTWILALDDEGGILPRRQELPQEAFVSVEELQAQFSVKGDGTLPIIAVSFCWDTASHPDPRGKHLATVTAALRRDRARFADRVYGAGFTEMGLFWDWASIHQKDHRLFNSNETPEAHPSEAARKAFLADLKAERRFYGGKAYELSRTVEEKHSFRLALHSTMDLWYAHQGTTVYMLTKLPEGTMRTNGYEVSGWTTFERLSAELLKPYQTHWKMVLDLGMAEDSTNTWNPQTQTTSISYRRWPVDPDSFDELIETKSFTNGADTESVKALYRKMSIAQLAGIKQFSFGGMNKLTVEDARRLGRCLNLCRSLQMLNMQNCFAADTFKALFSVLTHEAHIERLNFGGNRLGPEDAKCVAAFLGVNKSTSFVQLIACNLTNGGMDMSGVLELVEVVKHTSTLKHLELSYNDIDNATIAKLEEAAGDRVSLRLHW